MAALSAEIWEKRVCHIHGTYLVLEGTPATCPSCTFPMSVTTVGTTTFTDGTTTTTLDLEAWLAQSQALTDERDLWRNRAVELCRLCLKVPFGVANDKLPEWDVLGSKSELLLSNTMHLVNLLEQLVRSHDTAVTQGLGSPNPVVVRLREYLQQRKDHRLELNADGRLA